MNKFLNKEIRFRTPELSDKEILILKSLIPEYEIKINKINYKNLFANLIKEIILIKENYFLEQIKDVIKKEIKDSLENIKVISEKAEVKEKIIDLNPKIKKPSKSFLNNL